MYHHSEALRGRSSVKAVSLQWRERVKEYLGEMGEGMTSDLLKYSWGFLHFNLLFFKRWLCFPVWQLPGKNCSFLAEFS
jgi:hypothetical protein